MLPVIAIFLCGSVALLVFSRAFLKFWRRRTGIPAPVKREPERQLTDLEAIELLNSLYFNANAGAVITREKIEFLECNLRKEKVTGEILYKLTFLWKKAGMINPKKGEH